MANGKDGAVCISAKKGCHHFRLNMLLSQPIGPLKLHIRQKRSRPHKVINFVRWTNLAGRKQAAEICERKFVGSLRGWPKTLRGFSNIYDERKKS